MMYLILWEADSTFTPTDPQERVKLIMGMAERVKKDVDSGDTKMWGVCLEGPRVSPLVRVILKKYLPK